MANSPTNWIIASNEMISVGARVRLNDGRVGAIIRVAPANGLPLVRLDADGTDEAVHPAHIAYAIPTELSQGQSVLP